jgi:hypothetical protein
VAHTRACAISLRDPRTCRCECNGYLHGSAWIPNSLHAPEGRHAPSIQGEVRSRQRNVRRIAVATTVAVTATVGGLTVTSTFDSSASTTSHLSAQVNVDLKGTITALSSLGFGVKDASSSGAPGFLYSTDCSKNSTSLVAKFFTSHPCEQYIAETWTITRQDTTTLVAFSWVEMTTTTLASKYKAVVDAYGTGNPPGASAEFNGLCYASDQQGATVWTVEVKPTGKAEIDRGILQDAVKGDLSQGYLQKHCVK